MGGLKVWHQNNLIKFRLYCGSVIIVLSVNNQVLIYVKQVDLVTVLVLIKSFGKFRSGLILYVRGTRHKLAWKQKTCKSFHLHSSFDCSIDSYTKEAPFCFKSEFLRAQPCWFTLYQWRAEKDCLMRCFILLLHMLALFHSLTQTTGHKTAALTVMFS